MPTPFVLGAEGAGRVVALGPNVQGFAIDDRVAWALVSGSYADARRAHEDLQARRTTGKLLLLPR